MDSPVECGFISKSVFEQYSYSSTWLFGHLIGDPSPSLNVKRDSSGTSDFVQVPKEAQRKQETKFHNDAVMKKQHQQKLNGPQGRVPYPCWSSLTCEEQKTYIRMHKIYANEETANTKNVDPNELAVYKQLHQKVKKEQEAFRKFVRSVSSRTLQNYNAIHPDALCYVKEVLKSQCSRVQRYPQFYAPKDFVPLLFSNQIGTIHFRHLQTLLAVGQVPWLIFPKLKERTALSSCYAKLRKRYPVQELNLYDYDVCNVIHALPVSQDPNAEILAQKHNVNIVISSSGLRTLFDNQLPPLDTAWKVPVIVKEFLLDSGLQKVVFVDKHLPPKTLSVQSMNNWYHSIAAKVLLVHPKHKEVLKLKTCFLKPSTDPHKNKDLPAVTTGSVFNAIDGVHALEAYEVSKNDEIENRPSDNSNTVGHTSSICQENSTMAIVHPLSNQSDNALDPTKSGCRNQDKYSSDDDSEEDRLMIVEDEVMMLETDDKCEMASLPLVEDQTFCSPEECGLSVGAVALNCVQKNVNDTTMLDNSIAAVVPSISENINDNSGELLISKVNLSNSKSGREDEISDNDSEGDRLMIVEDNLVNCTTEYRDEVVSPSLNRNDDINSPKKCELVSVTEVHNAMGDVDEDEIMLQESQTLPLSDHGDGNNDRIIDGLSKLLPSQIDSGHQAIPRTLSEHDNDVAHDVDPVLQQEVTPTALRRSHRIAASAKKLTTLNQGSSSFSISQNEKSEQFNAKPLPCSQQNSHQLQKRTQIVKSSDNTKQKTAFDTILEGQEQFLKSVKTKSSMEISTENKQDELLEPEDPSLFIHPKSDGNSFYNLWMLDRLKILIRSHIDGYKRCANTQKREFWNFVTKLEYQPWYGGEVLTVSERAKEWIMAVVMPDSRLARVRLNAYTSEILKIEELQLSDLKPKNCGFKPSEQLSSLHKMFSKLNGLPSGEYMVTHIKGEGFIRIMKNVKTPIGDAIDIQAEVSQGVAENISLDSNQWSPVDPDVEFPYHQKFQRIPCTFIPKGFKESAVPCAAWKNLRKKPFAQKKKWKKRKVTSLQRM